MSEQVENFEMGNKLYMEAYYYSFEETGVREIDEILSAIAMAGKAFHHTEMWSEVNQWQDYSYVELIQEMANRAAVAWKKRVEGK